MISNYPAIVLVTACCLAASVDAMRAALEKAGVEFINVDQPGVRLRKPG